MSLTGKFDISKFGIRSVIFELTSGNPPAELFFIIDAKDNEKDEYVKLDNKTITINVTLHETEPVKATGSTYCLIQGRVSFVSE